MFNFKEIISVTLILFSVIDIIGVIPIIVDLRKKAGKIYSGKATIVAGVIMIAFLFLGEYLLNLFGIDVESFAITGAFIMFLLGIEMVLGITLFKHNPDASDSASVVPLAFPLIAGAGTLTTLISLKAEFQTPNIFIGILLNLAWVYIVLKSAKWLEKKLGNGGFNIIRKVFGIILLAISIKLFKTSMIQIIKVISESS